MYCPQCGKEFPDNASFCPDCGCKRPQMSCREPAGETGFSAAEAVKKDLYAESDAKKSQGTASSRQKPGKKKRVILIVVLAVIAFGVLCVAVFLFGGSDAESALATVRGGYLGEYTDMTTEELLDGYYGSFYSDSSWDSGVTDEGTIIVQLDYTDPNLETTTIQFSMLNEDCFEVSAFASPIEDIEEMTDILAALNKAYVTSYELQHMGAGGVDMLADVEAELMAHLTDISASSVLYGASKNYTGDRSQLYQLFGDSELALSVPELLSAYGILDTGTGGNAGVASEGETVDAALTEPNDVPNNLNACAVLDIQAGNYDTNYAWLESHLGQWVKLVGLYADSRMTDYNYSPTLYCFMYNEDEWGPGSYGDFEVTGPDNSMLIPLADGLSDTYYVFLDRDSYGGIIGINAFAENMDSLVSDPTG